MIKGEYEILENVPKELLNRLTDFKEKPHTATEAEAFLDYFIHAFRLKKINADDLKAKRYDGIKFSENEFVVFDSNQIKHINNKGKGGKFFNESEANIYFLYFFHQ